jgi:hypothetical protein
VHSLNVPSHAESISTFSVSFETPPSPQPGGPGSRIYILHPPIETNMALQFLLRLYSFKFKRNLLLFVLQFILMRTGGEISTLLNKAFFSCESMRAVIMGYCLQQCRKQSHCFSERDTTQTDPYLHVCICWSIHWSWINYCGNKKTGLMNYEVIRELHHLMTVVTASCVYCNYSTDCSLSNAYREISNQSHMELIGKPRTATF